MALVGLLSVTGSVLPRLPGDGHCRFLQSTPRRGRLDPQERPVLQASTSEREDPSVKVNCRNDEIASCFQDHTLQIPTIGAMHSRMGEEIVTARGVWSITRDLSIGRPRSRSILLRRDTGCVLGSGAQGHAASAWAEARESPASTRRAPTWASTSRN